MTRRVLFIPLHGSSLLEMLPVAEKLAEDECYEPVFFIFRQISVVHLAHLLARDIRMIGPKAHCSVENPKWDQVDTSIKRNNNSTSLCQKFKRWKQTIFNLLFFSFFWHVIKFGYQICKAKALLKIENVALLVLVGDRHVGWETVLIKVANDLDIPSLIVPFAMSDPHTDCQYRSRLPNSDQYKISSWAGRFLADQFPNWVYRDDKESFFFIPPGIALAAKFWGIMPDDPWTLGGGVATRMAVESPWLKKMFVEQGVSEDKMVVTGKPSIDQIFDLVQETDVEKMYQEWEVAGKQKVILCSVPQLAEHGLLTWEEHWQEIDFLVATLSSQPDAIVVLNLHPKSDPEQYESVAAKYGAILADQRIYSLLPACNIFVATYSSTVVQAIGVGKPTIVVDFYDLNYTLYNDAPGVVIVNQRKDFGVILNRLVTDREYYERLSKSQKENSSEWALLDGQCTRRVVDLIYGLAKS